MASEGCDFLPRGPWRWQPSGPTTVVASPPHAHPSPKDSWFFSEHFVRIRLGLLQFMRQKVLLNFWSQPCSSCHYNRMTRHPVGLQGPWDRKSRRDQGVTGSSRSLQLSSNERGSLRNPTPSQHPQETLPRGPESWVLSLDHRALRLNW